MPSIKDHCIETKAALGSDWFCVHKWLDECAGVYWPSKMHRAHRHHRDGIEEVRKLWGDQAADAARIHILADMGVVLDTAEDVERKYRI